MLDDLVDLAEPAVDVLELPVNGGKTNVCDVVDILQALHDEVADQCRRDLLFQPVGKLFFDVGDQFVNLLHGDRTLVARLYNAVFEFLR